MGVWSRRNVERKSMEGATLEDFAVLYRPACAAKTTGDITF